MASSVRSGETQPPRTLIQLLDATVSSGTGESVSVDDIVQAFGERSITPFILLTSLLLISPLSAIPGVPTISAALIILLSAQALVGAPRLWLPGVLLRRQLTRDRVSRATGWLRGPCAFFDRHAHKRLGLLVRPPVRQLVLCVCLILPVGWPFLELVPMLTTLSAAVIAILSFGLFTRDGLYVLAGLTLLASQALFAFALFV
ncbi:MAG: exopolysaccharide biosynthesis protein [Pseudomonadota bacterium]